MKRLSLAFIMVFALALSVLAQFQIPTNDGNAVQDRAGVLTVPQRTQLEGQLRTYQTATTRAIVVLIVPTLNGVPLEEYANKTFHAWGIGEKGKSNGVLFLWSTGDRKARIEVGYGLEGLLPDGRAGEILRESVLPNFKAGRNFDGVQGGVSAVITQLNHEPDAPVPTKPFKYAFVFVALGFILLLVVIAVVVIVQKQHERDRDAEEARLSRERFLPRARRSAAPVYIPVPFVAAHASPSYASHRDDDDESSSRSSSDDSSSSSSSDSDSSSSFGGFGGGDSGGGGASGSY